MAEQLNGAQPVLGEVVLIGAGPGDAGLLTLKGLQRLQQADVVLYDALVSPAVLNLVRRDAEKVCVTQHDSDRQEVTAEVSRLLLGYAQQGKRVVRLKGGDPFICDSGGEELQALADAGISFEVVPGITAAIGAAAYAGIPLTHRSHAHSVTFVSGRGRNGCAEPNWPLLAQSGQTLVAHVGAIRAEALAQQLVEHGRDGNTPVAVISHGTLSSQQLACGTLKELPVLVAQAAAPALMVIGETAALHRRLHWFGGQPVQFVDVLPPLAA